ncbi:MAG: SGNH/GDSL hydrolase family protein [Chlamydiae bacterium]|nr:SGNH/GDSL hydrolase family protein [Chlamydiota bacterium]
MRNGKKSLFILFTFLLLLLFVEMVSFFVTGALARRGWMAYIPKFSKEQIKKALENLNPTLGWGPQDIVLGRVTKLKPRYDSSSLESLEPCVSVYGDSFTYGGQEDKTYPHYLSQDLGCRVDNFGVPGYGSDQAYMRYKAQRHLDQAPYIILAHLSENILRNVNQYRNLLYPGGELLFKPRFILRDGNLIQLPICIQTENDFHLLENSPEKILMYDEFLERPRRDFPYTIALLRWLGFDFHVKAKLKGIPRYNAFYKSDHTSGALQLTVNMMRSFSQDVLLSGRVPIVLLIPTGIDMLYTRKVGKWPDQPLVEALEKEKFNVIHAGPALLKKIGDADPCSLYEECNGHFNSKGYKLLAEIVSNYFQTKMGDIRKGSFK